MKLRPVTKFDKRNKTTSKKCDDDVMSANCDVMVTFLIYGQFGAIWKPDSGQVDTSWVLRASLTQRHTSNMGDFVKVFNSLNPLEFFTENFNPTEIWQNLHQLVN